ncbi:uncharacterized protein LOC133449750 [Cololabis saira]|uniref:uncharacterized protein LOC133449750 n=1 Tax=Cololabis saira TaxID=129043 RepID=UPI002AD2C007|nr:uncharacterized protein LOC133449750 [Cololabis saira]
MSALVEAAAGLALGAAAGCMLGATEDPVDATLAAMTASGPLKPVLEEVRAVGPLGLGTLMGATALTAAMTSVIVGVVLAAAVAAAFVATGSCGPAPRRSAGLWVSAGLAGAVGTALAGAGFGMAVESVVQNHGMLGLLWALGVFTALKTPLSFVLAALWRRGEARCTLGRHAEREQVEAAEWQLRQRTTLQVERRMVALEAGGATGGAAEERVAWAAEQKLRVEMETRRTRSEEAAAEQRTARDWVRAVVTRYVDLLAFSGVPMTLVAVATAGLGLAGYGGHQAALIALLVLVVAIAYLLMSSSDFQFWMLVGVMAMIVSFVVAMLTLHAGQQAVEAARKLREAGRGQTRESVGGRMDMQSSLEALSAAVFVARMCQLGLGAAVGGALARRAAGRVEVTAGAAAVAGLLLVGVEVLAPALGDGGCAGALLGVVGAAGVSVGAVLSAAPEGQAVSWPGTAGRVAGVVAGALAAGRWHAVNIGLQLPVAYVFARIDPV